MTHRVHSRSSLPSPCSRKNPDLSNESQIQSLTRPSRPENHSLRILALPGELQNRIIEELDIFWQQTLRGICRYFRTIIPPLELAELFWAETCDFPLEVGLFTCRLCRCLRLSSIFADNMYTRKKKMVAGGEMCQMRFCVECGFKPPPGHKGYAETDVVKCGRKWLAKCPRCEAAPGIGSTKVKGDHSPACYEAKKRTKGQRKREKKIAMDQKEEQEVEDLRQEKTELRQGRKSRNWARRRGHVEA